MFPSSVASFPLFWEQEISSALDSRDSSYREAGVDTALFGRLQTAGDRLSALPMDTASPWHSFLTGMALAKDSGTAAAASFARAISLSEKDPGRLWVLSVEFYRCDMQAWEEKCLKKLEILFLASGARSAPVIVQQLLFRLSNANAHGNTRDSEFYGGWAQRFDRRCLWPSILAIGSTDFTNFPRAAAQIRDVFASLSASWESQLTFARAASKWLFWVLQTLIAGALIGLVAKYLSPALHISSERFPDIFSSRGKLLLALAAFFSVAFLGAIPFIWVIFFVIWRRLVPRDKRLAVCALMLFLLTPLGVRLSDMFDSALSESSSVQLYRKAIDEGYYPALDSTIASHALRSGKDYLAHTAAALYACKKGTPLSAFSHLKMAQMIAKDDPVVIVTAGNALYYAGDFQGARNAYQQCVRLYPKFEPAYFNLGQYYFGAMETAKGMEYTTQAARLDPEYVNAFIKKNDECFSKDWPPLRQLVWPDFAPSYFWRDVFPSYCGTWNSASPRFGPHFFGLPLTWYLALSAFLAILLFTLDVSIWSKDVVKRVSSCKLCQTPVCRKCKRGSICRDCFSATQHIRNEQIRQRIMGKIQVRSLRFRAMTAIVLDLIYPGAGLVYRGAPLYQSGPLLAVTSVVYASFAFLIQATFEYPTWILGRLSTPLICVFAAYWAIFVVRAAIKSVAVLTRQEE